MEAKSYEEMSGADLVAEYNRLVAELGREPLKIKKFESRAIGIRRIKAVENEIAGGVPEFLDRTASAPPPKELPETQTTFEEDPPREPPRERTEEEKILLEADKRWRSWMPTKAEHRSTRPRKSTFVKAVRKEIKDALRKSKSDAKQAEKDQRAQHRKVRTEARTKASIETAGKRKRMEQVIRVLSETNPRREGTDAHRYFEAMTGGPTVGEYLAKFPSADHRKALQWLWNTCRDGYVTVIG